MIASLELPALHPCSPDFAVISIRQSLARGSVPANRCNQTQICASADDFGQSNA